MEPFKNIFGFSAALWLMEQLHGHWPELQPQHYLQQVQTQPEALAFKARIDYLAQQLHACCPLDFAEFCRRLPAVLGPRPSIDPNADQGWTEEFRWLILSRYVSLYGLQHPELALPALGELTLHFSAEFDLRPFLLHHPELAWAYCQQLMHSPDWRQRRLASEGTRPRLPWGLRLQTLIRDPSPSWPILLHLRHDTHPNVRRSVANHLNDLSKDHPDWLVTQLQTWADDGVNPALIRHGLRSLLKAGHTGALQLQGLASDFALQHCQFSLPRQVELGQSLTMQVQLQAAHAGHIMVDFELCYPGQHGRTRHKIIKGRRATLNRGDWLNFAQKLDFKAVTVRHYYPGPAEVRLWVNGQAVASQALQLLASPVPAHQ